MYMFKSTLILLGALWDKKIDLLLLMVELTLVSMVF